MRLNVLIRRVERLQGKVDSVVRSACMREEKWIVEANRKQMMSGYNASGELMNEGLYSDIHYKKRVKMGLPVDHVYLSLTGDFQKKMYVEYSDTGFAVQSDDRKNWLAMQSMLTGYWPSDGEDPYYGKVFGLTMENKMLLSRRIAPRVAANVRKQLLK